MEQFAWVVQRRMEQALPVEPRRWIEYEATLPKSTSDLSTRELDVLELVAVGRTDAEIADRLSISPRTVGAHISNMLNKTSAKNRVELVIWAIACGVLMLTVRDSIAPN